MEQAMRSNETRSDRSTEWSVAEFSPEIRVPAHILDEARERYEQADHDQYELDGRKLLEEFIMDHMVNWNYIRKPAVPMTCDGCGNRWSFSGIEAESACPNCGKPNPV